VKNALAYLSEESDAKKSFMASTQEDSSASSQSPPLYGRTALTAWGDLKLETTI